MSKLSQKDLDVKMRQALKDRLIKSTKELARIYGTNVARADSSLARVTRQRRRKK